MLVPCLTRVLVAVLGSALVLAVVALVMLTVLGSHLMWRR